MNNGRSAMLMLDEADPHDPPCPFYDANGEPCQGSVVYMERDGEEHVYRVWCSTEGKPNEGCASDGELASSDELPRDVLAWAQDLGFVGGDDVGWCSDEE